MKNKTITPAALVAALSGDFENFLVASTAGGIEAQEKRGQMRQAEKETLPVDGTSKPEQRAQFESLGFKFTGVKDGLFEYVDFPAGWSKKPTDHSMWSDLLDPNGIKRGGIFYKAAFYDQNAHVSLSGRFYVDQTYGDGPITVYVKDELGKVKHEIGGLTNPSGIKDRPEMMAAYEAIDAARLRVRAWLNENYPDNQSPLAYWTN